MQLSQHIQHVRMHMKHIYVMLALLIIIIHLLLLQVMLLLVIEVIASKVLTGRGELPPATQKLGACYYAERAAAEAETAATAVIHLSSAAGALYQRQYKQQLGGYNKLH